MVKNNEQMLHEIKKDKIKYYYTGPVYKFDNIYREKWSGNTYAVSAKQALNQLIYQFKQEDGWVVDTAFHLDPKYLTSDNLDMKTPKVNSTKPQVEIKYCPNCGTRLTDGGYCPVCDDGDEEALEEDIISLENCNNIEEELSMENNEELTEDIFADEEETEKDKEFDKKFGKYANVPLSFDKFNKLMQEMIDFYDLDDDLDINLTEDIEKHDDLNPLLFENDELKPDVKEAIEKIAEQFINGLKEDKIKFYLEDIVLVGSNVSYNYTKDSDLDIHLIANSDELKCPDDLYPLLYSAYRSIFNSNYDLTIKGIPAEIYVEMDKPTGKSNGIYSIYNGWIKHPVQENIPELDTKAFDKLFNKWESQYFDIIENVTDVDKIDDFIEDVYDLRKNSIAKDGEYGLGNLVFKEFRNLGYLDNLKELKRKEIEKDLSLESLNCEEC